MMGMDGEFGRRVDGYLGLWLQKSDSESVSSRRFDSRGQRKVGQEVDLLQGGSAT
jgi:hypothetical protein